MPSEPTKSPLRLYPADDFLGLLLVLITVPSDSTTVRLMTQSFMVPYLTALVPLQLVPTMPPIFALGPAQLVSSNRGRSTCVLTWVNREEQSRIALRKLLVQILPPNARLDDHVHVIFVELENLVHVREIDTDATERS